MMDLSLKLSAYLDGELDPTEMAEIEALIETDEAAQAELDALMQADAFARESFSEELDQPVPFALAQKIKAADLVEPVPARRQIWGALAASLICLTLGGLGGYAVKVQQTPVQTVGWLAAIADYHAIYAGQERHLVEVGADESDHIETWLGKTVGADFSIPDLTGHGLTFEGGRLVVANGKPVAQLMYRQPDGVVIALCLQQSNKDPSLAPSFNERTIRGFDFVSWSANGADYVVIGPEGQPDLEAIANTASLEI
ncbi:anti-sigma factor [Rhodobacteraceae bacterium]|nr:anti-sigma factor [Paracoccaceae bacterium]